MKMLVSFSSNSAPYVSQFQYYIIEYNIEGEMVGDMRPIENELMLCSPAKVDALGMSQFGTNYERSCVMDLKSYLTKYETRFY